MSFYKSWLKRRVSLRMIMAIILILGVISAYNLPLDISPSVEFPRLTISVYAPNSSPEIIEGQITSVIEARVQTIPDINKIKSVSRENSCRVTLELNKDADIQYTTFLISEVLADYKDWLPDDARKPSIIKYIPKEFRKKRFMSYRLSSNLPESYLNRVWEEKIKPALLNTNGVAQVEIFGIRKQILKILLDPQVMTQYNISLFDVRNNLFKKKNAVGFIYKNAYKNNLVIDGRFNSIEEIKNLPVKIIGSKIIRIKNVARVFADYEDPYSIKRINGKNTYLLVIDKEMGANTINVADEVYKKINRLDKEYGGDIIFYVENDSSEEIRQSVSGISMRAAISIAAMFFLLWFVYRKLSASLTVIFNILLAVNVVLIFIYIFNYSLNLLTIGGIALGLGFVIDNAILAYDAVISDRTLEKLKNITAPIVASTLTTLTALFPFLFLTGDLKIYYVPFAFVITVTLIASVIMALMFIPHLVHIKARDNISANTPDKGNGENTTRFREHIIKKYKLILKRPLIVSLLALWIFGIPLWLLPENLPQKEGDAWHSQIYNDLVVPVYDKVFGNEFVVNYIYPVLGGSTYLFVNHVDRGEIWRWKSPTYLGVYLNLPHGSEMGIVKKNILPFEKKALQSKGVKKVETTIYGETANIRIDFTKRGLTEGSQYYLKNELTKMAVDVGGAEISVFGFEPGFSTGFSGSVSNFRIYLYGYNYLDLKNIALKFKNTIEKNPRIRNVDINGSGYFSKKVSHLVLQIDKNKLASENLGLYEVLPVIRLNNYSSLSRNRIQIAGKEMLYEIKTTDYKNAQIEGLYSKSHYSALGKLFRFKHFSKYDNEKMMGEIKREDQQYERVVGFDYLGPYEFGKEYLDGIIDRFSLPPGYTLIRKNYSFGDDTDYSELYIIVLAGLLLIYMVTAALYESFKYPFLIFLTIPAGIIGIFLIFYFMDITFDSSAYLGVLFISGIVVNNAIILVSRFQLNLSNKMTLIQAITEGVLQHLRPILLTTLTTIIGFVPLVILSDQTSGGIWYSLAVAGIGGILSSFIFILLVLPALFYIFEKKT